MDDLDESRCEVSSLLGSLLQPWERFRPATPAHARERPFHGQDYLFIHQVLLNIGQNTLRH